ncbi:putative transcription regulator protein [Paraburkholderia ribeironis]|uniref:Putative transcription regulator protein n=1 Tax=Paraburkholderia ribeironis TaxID=1247936 RepID=A0A1N7SIS8_9BURK|nr:LysR family transcriptional regulator [Paraburkholderia ribeironis]SIT47256.1 putative transcription regulator protein [Paraburkholderia ribeironis]
MGDIRTLDLNLLKTLDALLDERNVTRTAERLSLTQPAVSGMLTRLRENFDDPLFVRTQRGIVPTLRALELAAPVKRVLAEIGALLQPQEFEPASADFTLSIAGTDYALRSIIVPFLTALRQRAPGIRLAVRPIEGTQVQTQLERGELDLALMTPESTPQQLHTQRLFDEHYICALRDDHPDAARGRMTLERFCSLDHALVSWSGDLFTGVTDAALARLGRQRRVALSVASFLVLPEILRTSDLLAVVPRRLIRESEGLALLAPPLEIPGFTKMAVWHERTDRDPAHRWVRELLFETCAERAADHRKPAKPARSRKHATVSAKA